MSLFNRKPKETLLLAEERSIAGRHVSLRPTKLCISMTLLSVATPKRKDGDDIDAVVFCQSW